MAGLGDIKPREGARVTLRQRTCDGTTAHYDVRLSTSGDVWTGSLTVEVGASPQISVDPDTPGWLQQAAVALVHATCRGLAPIRWPRRLTRWRAAPPPNGNQTPGDD